ncbi:MAG TPA: hypothetical protein VIL12_06205 [Acidimicrobiia bacterium]
MRGHPVLGAVSGFVFGVSLAIMIQQFGLRPLNDQLTFFGLPALFLVVGIVLAAWAPVGRRSGPETPPPAR